MKIYIYGIGNNFIRAYRWLSEHFEICGLIDGARSVQGRKICSYQVEDISILLEKQYDLVVVTPNRFADIINTITELGIPKEKVAALCHVLKREDIPKKEDLFFLEEPPDKDDSKSNHTSVSIGFLMGGGAGNKFVQMNFLYCLKQYLMDEPVEFVVFGDTSKELNRLLMEKEDFVSKYYLPSETEYLYDCDVLVQLEFYPNVLFPCGAWIEKTAPKLFHLLRLWWSFMSDSARQRGMLIPSLNHDAYQYCIKEQRNVLSSYDVDGSIRVGQHYRWKLRLAKAPCDLEGFGLETLKYITIQRGASPLAAAKESTKLWSVHNYEKLIGLLKERYPDKKIVQLGETENSEKLAGADVNLLGQTTWSTLGIILKNAYLHIDGECGMVHYRKALHAGPSVVMFGPTPIKFYGYLDNINIRSDFCPNECARLTDTWSEQCLKGFELAPCMETITPEMVMERIKEWEETNEY